MQRTHFESTEDIQAAVKRVLADISVETEMESLYICPRGLTEWKGCRIILLNCYTSYTYEYTKNKRQKTLEELAFLMITVKWQQLIFVNLTIQFLSTHKLKFLLYKIVT